MPNETQPNRERWAILKHFVFPVLVGVIIGLLFMGGYARARHFLASHGIGDDFTVEVREFSGLLVTGRNETFHLFVKNEYVDKAYVEVAVEPKEESAAYIIVQDKPKRIQIAGRDTEHIRVTIMPESPSVPANALRVTVRDSLHPKNDEISYHPFSVIE